MSAESTFTTNIHVASIEKVSSLGDRSLHVSSEKGVFLVVVKILLYPNLAIFHRKLDVGPNTRFEAAK